MRRCHSQDSNVADHLVVEADDGDAMPPGPDSPSPEPHDQANCGQHWNAPTSPDLNAYSILPSKEAVYLMAHCRQLFRVLAGNRGAATFNPELHSFGNGLKSHEPTICSTNETV